MLGSRTVPRWRRGFGSDRKIYVFIAYPGGSARCSVARAARGARRLRICEWPSRGHSHLSYFVSRERRLHCARALTLHGSRTPVQRPTRLTGIGFKTANHTRQRRIIVGHRAHTVCTPCCMQAMQHARLRCYLEIRKTPMTLAMAQGQTYQRLRANGIISPVSRAGAVPHGLLPRPFVDLRPLQKDSPPPPKEP